MSTPEDMSDGGPAFPCAEDHKVAADIPWTCGMSKRELFAAILMHGELATCGVPGEAADALVEASRASGDDVVDHMASNAVEAADALLRALGAPRPVQYRRLYADEQMRIDAADRLASTVRAMQECAEYAALPPGLRTQIERDLADVDDPEIPF